MTLKEAMAIIDKYELKSVLTEDEEFLLLEALDFMIETTKETKWMVRLGGYHYDKRNFDLALKYYEMADELGDKWAAEGLGYIWYYGRTGETDYEKAFKYYQKAMENGNLRSMVKVADMYKNGYGVEKNKDIYVELIEEAYGYVEGAQFLHEPLPEVCTRLAKIRVEQGKISEAVWLYFTRSSETRRGRGTPQIFISSPESWTRARRNSGSEFRKMIRSNGRKPSQHMVYYVKDKGEYH